MTLPYRTPPHRLTEAVTGLRLYRLRAGLPCNCVATGLVARSGRQRIWLLPYPPRPIRYRRIPRRPGMWLKHRGNGNLLFLKIFLLRAEGVPERVSHSWLGSILSAG